MAGSESSSRPPGCRRIVNAAVTAPRARRDDSNALPEELQANTAERLRVVALLYAFVFFTVGPLTALVDAEQRVLFFSTPLGWAPPLASIAVALFFAWMTRLPGVCADGVLTAGLVFQVVGSYGIASAQYLDTSRYAFAPPWAGLSWVAVWMLSYSIIIPSPPKRALIAAVGSASAVPVVALLASAAEARPIPIAPVEFCLRVVLPYLLVVVVSYVGARVVFSLGTELTRALELGSYRLVEPIGQGGMGEVWRAEHRLLARPAAVKLIRPDHLGHVGASDLERRSRFEREAQAISALRSPHTIELYDFGVAEGDTFFYVMELLDGFDLQVLVDRFGPMPARRAVHILQQVCHSLAEAHDHGLVHRDVKPANVYVCRYGSDVDFVKVLDFGLVKPVEREEGPTLLALTGAHLAQGTPAFMSPEQALGNRPVDGRSDIYSLGCLAYWLVTGKQVFEGRTSMQTILHHVQSAPDPPSRHAPHELPREFDELVLWCLEKDPDRRPPDAHVVMDRLRALASEARWSPDTARRWWQEHGPEPHRSWQATPVVPEDTTLAASDRWNARSASAHVILRDASVETGQFQVQA